jgi:hypothetical protein
MYGSNSAIAAGNIKPKRFLKQGAVPGTVLQAGAGEAVYGISHDGTRNLPLEGWDDGFHAKAGENCGVYGNGCKQVPITAGGVVAVGDYLKADADGRAVAASADRDAYGAIARTTATAAGQEIMVDVVLGERSKA